MHNQRTKKPPYLDKNRPSDTYGRKPLKQLTLKVTKSKEQFLLEDSLNDSASEGLKNAEPKGIRSKSKEGGQMVKNIKKSDEEIKSLSIDGLEDLSIIRSSKQKHMGQHIEKGSVEICDEQGSDEDIPLFDSDIMHESIE